MKQLRLGRLRERNSGAEGMIMGRDILLPADQPGSMGNVVNSREGSGVQPRLKKAF